MARENNKVAIRENSLLARLGAIRLREKRMALTFGSTIHLYNVSKEKFLHNRSWVCHELKHVEQYKRMGFWKFLWKYLAYSAKYGYHNNPLEIEAREAECDTGLLAKYSIDGRANETKIA